MLPVAILRNYFNSVLACRRKMVINYIIIIVYLYSAISITIQWLDKID